MCVLKGGWDRTRTSSCLDSSDKAVTLSINQSINSASNRPIHPLSNREPSTHSCGQLAHTPLIQWLTCAGADQYSPQWHHCKCSRAQRPGSVCAVYFQGGRVVRGPNLSPAPFLLHLDDQSQVKRKGAGEGHTEPMSRSSWRQQPANQHQLVKKPADETHNNKQDSVQFKKQKTKHNVKCIFS